LGNRIDHAGPRGKDWKLLNIEKERKSKMNTDNLITAEDVAGSAI
jgi:hypothetical protein